MVADHARYLLFRHKPVFREGNDGMRRLLVARAVAAHEIAGGVTDLYRDFITRLREIVIKDGAGGRVVAHGRFRWPGCVVLKVAAETIGCWRTKERGRLRGHIRVELTERLEVVEDPKRAAMRGDDQVVVVNDEVVDGRDRKVQVQRLPSLAIVERNVGASLSPGVEQAFT